MIDGSGFNAQNLPAGPIETRGNQLVKNVQVGESRQVRYCGFNNNDLIKSIV